MSLRLFLQAGSGRTIEVTVQGGRVRYRRDVDVPDDAPAIPILNHEYDRLITRHNLLRRHWGHGINVKRVLRSRQYNRPPDEVVQAILAELRANPEASGKMLALKHNVHPATISRYRSGHRRRSAVKLPPESGD